MKIEEFLNIDKKYIITDKNRPGFRAVFLIN